MLLSLRHKFIFTLIRSPNIMNGTLDYNTVAKFLYGQLVGKDIKIVQPSSLNKPKPASIAFATSPEILK